MTNCGLTDMITSRLIVRVMKRVLNFQARRTNIPVLPQCNV